MMEEVSTSETSIIFYETVWRDNPEDNHLHTRRPENLKSHALIYHQFLNTKILSSINIPYFSGIILSEFLNRTAHDY
jgi:hypothetical protein